MPNGMNSTPGDSRKDTAIVQADRQL
jgi:hypothetical protein